jgi:hypothetical protein
MKFKLKIRIYIYILKKKVSSLSDPKKNEVIANLFTPLKKYSMWHFVWNNCHCVNHMNVSLLRLISTSQRRLMVPRSPLAFVKHILL